MSRQTFKNFYWEGTFQQLRLTTINKNLNIKFQPNLSF